MVDTTNYYSALKYIRNSKDRGLPEPMTKDLVVNFFDMFNINMNNPEMNIWEHLVPYGKVDACLKLNGVFVFVEIKRYDNSIKKMNKNQLISYMNCVDYCSVGIITNGIQYEFYTKNASVMPFQTFLEIDMDADKEDVKRNLYKLERLVAYNFQYQLVDFSRSIYQIKNLVPDKIIQSFIMGSNFQNDESSVSEISKEKENREVVDDDEKTAKNTKDFSFIRKTIDLMRLIKMKKAEKILFGFNLINIFGHLSPDKEYLRCCSLEMVNNQEFVKKHQSSVFYVIYEKDEIKDYFKCSLNILGVKDTNIVFLPINMKNEIISIILKDMRFDVAILNPPYLNGQFKAILDAAIDCTKSEIVSISPISYYKKRKGSFISKVNECESEVILINHIDYFDGANAGLLAVTHINLRKYVHNITLAENFSKYDAKETTTIENIADFNYSRTNPVMLSLNSISKKFIEKNGSLHSLVRSHKTAKYGVDEENAYPEPSYDEKYVVQLSTMTGKMGNFYTSKQFTFFNTVPEIERYKDVAEYNEKQESNEDRKLYFVAAKTKNEARNLLLYLQTDAARAFLAVSKMVPDVIGSRACKSVPLVDFNDDDLFRGSLSKINKRLCKYFGFSKELLNLIKTHALFANVYKLKR